MNNKGFTLIEVMISTGLFVVLMVLGIAAILNSNTLFQKNQDQRAVFDNMAFVVEDMTRMMRTGSAFRCGPSNPILSESPQDCSVLAQGPLKNIMSFEAFNGEVGLVQDQVAYAIATDGLYKKEREGKEFFKMTPSSMTFNLAQSGFAVRGSLPTDDEQPLIFVRLIGEIEDGQGNFTTEFSYQFSVTPRRID